MTPTHTRKKGNRLYRYYVAAELLKGRTPKGSFGRVPAGEIEAAVIDHVRGLLRVHQKSSLPPGELLDVHSEGDLGS